METSLLPIKLLAIDIDGTLLNPQKQITPRTRAAIQAAHARDIIVTLATARRYGNSQPLAEELGIAIPLITYDGALIISHPEQQILSTQPLAAEVAQQAVEIMHRHHVQPVIHRMVESCEETCAGLTEFDGVEMIEYIRAYPNIRRMPHNDLCVDQADPLRVVAFASEEAVMELVPEMAALDCLYYTIRRGNYGCAEIVVMHKDCSKASGLKTLADLLNIPLAQVMTIGDNVNDLAMLQIAGWGVAMGQAPEEVKASAQAVTASNREDGAAQAIERYALSSARDSSSNSFSRATWR